MYRLAISNQDNNCPFCSSGLPEGYDFCASCQYTYWSETEFRTDYADYTVGWFDSVAEVSQTESELKGY